MIVGVHVDYRDNHELFRECSTRIASTDAGFCRVNVQASRFSSENGHSAFGQNLPSGTSGMNDAWGRTLAVHQIANGQASGEEDIRLGPWQSASSALSNLCSNMGATCSSPSAAGTYQSSPWFTIAGSENGAAPLVRPSSREVILQGTPRPWSGAAFLRRESISGGVHRAALDHHQQRTGPLSHLSEL